MTIPFRPKIQSLTKDDLVKFYESISHKVVRMMFINYCVSGLRRSDVLFLLKSELDQEKRMIVKNNGSSTKHRWITFYNHELAELLHPYLESRSDQNPRVYPVAKWKTFGKQWRKAQEKSGLHIRPKDLRDWFCNEMLRLGVQPMYIDAFCGRVPKGILGRYYVSYSPMKLKEIYEKADIRIFT